MSIPEYQGKDHFETMEQLNQLRLALMDLLRNNGGLACCNPRYSLFSSVRNYRADELYNGLKPNIEKLVFSKN